MKSFYGNGGSLSSVITMLLLERVRWCWGGCREHNSMSVPEEEVSQWAGQQEMAGTHLHTYAHGHTQKHSCTWSRCNLQWQRQAGLGIGPLSVVITVFPLWPCECSRAWAHVCCVINSALIHHDKMCVLVCAGLLLSHSLLPSACRTGSQGEKLGLCVYVCLVEPLKVPIHNWIPKTQWAAVLFVKKEEI